MYAIVFVGSDQKQKKKGVVTFIVLIRNTDPSRRINIKCLVKLFTVFYSAKFKGNIGFLCAGGGQVLLRTGTRQKTVLNIWMP